MNTKITISDPNLNVDPAARKRGRGHAVPESNSPGDIAGRKRQRDSSFLVAETKSMERKRRRMEQDGERRMARVHEREHTEEESISQGNTLEEAADNGILQHPYLDNPRFDGVDPNLNPEPPLNTAARREYDNEKRKQEQEKQLRLGNMPRFNSTPTPRGP